MGRFFYFAIYARFPNAESTIWGHAPLGIFKLLRKKKKLKTVLHHFSLTKNLTFFLFLFLILSLFLFSFLVPILFSYNKSAVEF